VATFKPTHRVKFQPSSGPRLTIEVRATAKFYRDEKGRTFRASTGTRCDAGKNIWHPESIFLSTLEPIA